jgi:beta-glucosidase
MNNRFCNRLVFLAILSLLLTIATASAQAPSSGAPAFPWMDRTLSPDDRANMVLSRMTLDEKIALLHGNGMAHASQWQMPLTYLANGGAGYVEGVKRLGIPPIFMSDAAYGVRDSAENGRYSTALTSNLGSAASWDSEAACRYGALIGRELRAQGYNMTLGGGVNITREPRNGRTFEYMGEDPILAGTLVGNRIRCEQGQHVIGDIKHYAVNDQESGRNEVNAIIGQRVLHETDLLAFEIGIGIGQPAAVMCSYNAINGDFACENKYLLTDVLKGRWKYPGFVVSDWGGTHSTVKASAAGLDNEEPMADFFGPKLKQAMESGQVPMSQIDDHARRILRSEFASGMVDYPTKKSVVDVEGGLEIARKIEEQSIVLLKNDKSVLPLDHSKLRSIAVIGFNADIGMISGGGSAQVDPQGSSAPEWQAHVWFPTSPLRAVRAQAPSAEIKFNSGANPATAATLAKSSDVAIVFAHQWMSEGTDLPSLSLPDNQDALIAAVAAANPRTIVVLETGTAVTMPWIDKVSGVLEAWYGGSKGADAVANVLFGHVNPSAKLPMTFPLSDNDLPRTTVMQPPIRDRGPETGALLTSPTFDVHYDEGLKVGYKWYDAEKKPVLFPFGYGLSYTTYAYSDLKVRPGKDTTVTFTVKNTGSRAGAEIAQVYTAFPAEAGEPPKRLVGWTKVQLGPGESKQVTVTVPPLYLSIYDADASSWKLLPGSYTMMAGGSSNDLPLTANVNLK